MSKLQSSDLDKNINRPAVDGKSAEPYAEQLYAHDAVAEPLDGLASVTDKHVREVYRSQGFLAINHAFTADEVEAAKQGLCDLAMGRKPAFQHIQFEAAVRDRLDELSAEERLDGIRKLMWFCEHDERLGHMSSHAKLLDVVSRLMGGQTPKCFQEMALSKPPRIGREKPWHQDAAYFDLAPQADVVGVWIALDEATIANGCMRVLAGGNQIGPVHHWQRRDWQICDTDIEKLHDKKHPVLAVPLKPGGLMMFNGLLPHGTPQNTTGERRRALQFHYCPENVEWTSKEDRLAIYGTEGKDVEC